MPKTGSKKVSKLKKYTLPVIIERDEDGFFVIECPSIPGCFTQGKTLDKAMANLEEVLELLLEDKEYQEMAKIHANKEYTFTTITI
jgi:predicted RNase H-like HicB family nuclease